MQQNKLKYVVVMKDMLIITIGLMVSSLGAVLFYQADLGSAPLATFCDGLHIIFGISYGKANILANLLLFIVLVLVKREYINIGTVMCVVFVGPFIDLFMLVFADMNIENSSMFIRLVFIVVGTIFMGVGLGLYVSVNRGLGALEALVKYFCLKTSLSFSRVKIIQDVLLVVVGIALTASWGIGTVIAVLLTGPILEWSIKFFLQLAKKDVVDVKLRS